MIRNNIIEQKMNVTRSLLEDIKTEQLKCYGHVQRMEEGRLPKKTTASNVPIVAPNVITSLSLTGNRDWVLCIEYEVFI
jgi:hypothetical protein